MTNTAANEELDRFIENYRRVYKYRQEFIPDHYVCVVKLDNEYSIQKQDSTTDIPDFNKELFIKLLIKEELIFETASAYSNPTDLRTGGCTCGAWSTRHPDHHSPICRKYVK